MAKRHRPERERRKQVARIGRRTGRFDVDLDRPNRAERRGLFGVLKAQKKRATRARDAAAHKAGRGTPAQPIGVAIRLAGAHYLDGDSDGSALIGRTEKKEADR